MSQTADIFRSFELEKAWIKHKENNDDVKAREVGWEWCNLRDSLSGVEKERFIAAAVEADRDNDMSDEAWEFMKTKNPIMYEVHMALIKKS